MRLVERPENRGRFGERDVDPGLEGKIRSEEEKEEEHEHTIDHGDGVEEARAGDGGCFLASPWKGGISFWLCACVQLLVRRLLLGCFRQRR